jgi:hypothetical protein
MFKLVVDLVARLPGTNPRAMILLLLRQSRSNTMMRREIWLTLVCVHWKPMLRITRDLLLLARTLTIQTVLIFLCPALDS